MLLAVGLAAGPIVVALVGFVRTVGPAFFD